MGPAEHDDQTGDGTSPPPPSRSIAARLDHLFLAMAPKGKSFSYQAVADAINARSAETGVTLSHATIWELRTGKRSDPRLSQLQALADFFGVPLGYFTDDSITAEVDEDIATLRALNDAQVRLVATRASGLSAAGLRAVTAMIDAMQGMENESDKTDG